MKKLTKLEKAYYQTGDVISFLAGAKMDISNNIPITIEEANKALSIVYDIQKAIAERISEDTSI